MRRVSRSLIGFSIAGVIASACIVILMNGLSRLDREKHRLEARVAELEYDLTQSRMRQGDAANDVRDSDLRIRSLYSRLCRASLREENFDLFLDDERKWRSQCVSGALVDPWITQKQAEKLRPEAQR